MKCKITFSGGSSGGFSAFGELNFGAEGFSVFYELDGDKCLLTYSNGSIIQERRGNVPLRMIFTEGKQTSCTLGGEGLSGSFPLYTQKLAVATDKKSVNINLSYTCAGESVKLDVCAAGY